MRTRFGEATVNGLDANASYQFRVRAVNADGTQSLPGKATVVNTLLEAPAAPQLALVNTRLLRGGVVRGELGQAAADGRVPVGGGRRAAVPSAGIGRENPRRGQPPIGSDGVAGGYNGRFVRPPVHPISGLPHGSAHVMKLN